MTLTEFLLARIAEDQTEAGAVLADTYYDWGSYMDDAGMYHTSAAHFAARHDPARVLAECEAKRRIVNDWQTLTDRVDDQRRPLHLFDPVTSMLLKATEPWLRHLATVYAGHPDYREEWRPYSSG
jgi:hypothetical protein